jgi:hypothetical protein
MVSSKNKDERSARRVGLREAATIQIRPYVIRQDAIKAYCYGAEKIEGGF